jgi:transposase
LTVFNLFILEKPLMTTLPVDINQTLCQIVELSYTLATSPCDQCGQPANRFTTASRMAIDLHLGHPVLLHLTVSVHCCEKCQHYFRVQPPFLRPGAVYTNRVVAKAVATVYQDHMAFRRATDRLARDFWVQPSEKMIRTWCQAYSQALDFETDYQPWVVREFSGILCIDEVYQDELALLLAVDPAAPEGDRLVGYQLVTGAVEAGTMETFLNRLKGIGLEPVEVVTDGSSLYPAVLRQIWPQAAHQLCLFHETRRMTKAVMKLINQVRRTLPTGPTTTHRQEVRGLRSQPPTPDPTDLATQRWQRRQQERRRQIALVHGLAGQGFSQRAIARQTGFSRPTVKKWLAQPCPVLPPDELETDPVLEIPSPLALKQAKIRQVHALAQAETLSYSEIARRTGVHRVTVKKWLQSPPPPVVEPASFQVPTLEISGPPAPWSDWEQVQQIRDALQTHRFLLLRRPEHLTVEEQGHVAALLTSPVGPALQVGRDCLVDWYHLWRDEQGHRRSIDEARYRYEAWQTNPAYREVPVLHKIQQQVPTAKFEQISHFLRQPEWEATNNGAERTGRAFRHRQAPHFNLRSQTAIDQALKVSACLHKEVVTASAGERWHYCQRGRKRDHSTTVNWAI